MTNKQSHLRNLGVVYTHEKLLIILRQARSDYVSVTHKGYSPIFMKKIAFSHFK